MTLNDGALNILNNCLAVRKGEKVLIVSDTDRKTIGHVFFNAARDLGAEVAHLEMLPREEDGQEPPKMVDRAMRNAGVVILATTYSLTHTTARRMANRNGARIVSMPGVTKKMLSSGAMTADYREISKHMKKVAKHLVGSKELEITSESGTNLTINIKKRDWVVGDNGLCFKKEEFTTLPAGELFIAPVEHLTNGRVVIDGIFEEVLEKPVDMWITKGVATKVMRARHLKDIFQKYGKKIVTVSRIGIGLNPAAKLEADSFGAKKRLGIISVSFGDNTTIGGRISCPISITGIITNATLKADGKTIVENGKILF